MLVNIQENDSSPLNTRTKSNNSLPTTKKASNKTKAKDEYFRKRKDELRSELVRDRFAFLERTLDNPLYENESLKEPWKVVGR